MPSHVALLRGINVGGHSKVAMSDLRDIVASLGHTDVSTYIQSGNVLFTTRRRNNQLLATEMERALAERLPVQPRVVVLSRDELAEVIAANPFPDEPEPRLVHAIFLADEPDAQAKAALATAEQRAAAKGGNDELRLIGRTVYLHVPGGYGRSELAAQLSKAVDTRKGITGTARNWATVTKLLALCDARPAG